MTSPHYQEYSHYQQTDPKFFRHNKPSPPILTPYPNNGIYFLGNGNNGSQKSQRQIYAQTTVLDAVDRRGSSNSGDRESLHYSVSTGCYHHSENSSSNSNPPPPYRQRRLSLISSLGSGNSEFSSSCSSASGKYRATPESKEERIYAASVHKKMSASVIDQISNTFATAGRQHQNGTRNGSQLYDKNVGGYFDGKATLGRRAQKLAQKAQQKLTIASISSELSSSASALYQLFTASAGSAEGSATSNGSSKNCDNVSQHYSALLSSVNGTADSPSEYATINPIEQFFLDRQDVVSGHTSRGIDFMERFAQFLKDRALIEEEYASKLRSLVKKSRGKKDSEEDKECKAYSYMNAFASMLTEMESLAAQHEVIGESLRKELVPGLAEKCRALRNGRKRFLQEFEALKAGLEAKVEEMRKQERAYEKAFKEAQYAYIKYDKADKNRALSRLEVDKARAKCHQNSQLCEQSKQTYASQLSIANQAKYDYFNVSLPKFLEEMRRLDVDRIESTRNAMLESVRVEVGVLSIIQRCYNDMTTAVNTINPERDTLVVVEQSKTGYSYPVDYQFRDLGDPACVLTGSNGGGSSGGSTDQIDGTATIKRASGGSANGKGVPRKHSMRIFGSSSAATSGGKMNGSGTSSGTLNGGGDYGHLPPQQRCRKIQSRLDELDKELKIKKQSLEGLERMHTTYADNPRLGNAAEVMEQIQQNRRELDQLNERVARFNELLHDAQSELNQPFGGAAPPVPNHAAPSPGASPRQMSATVAATGLRRNDRTSYSEESTVSSEGSLLHLRITNGHAHNHSQNQHQQPTSSSSSIVSNSIGGLATSAQKSASPLQQPPPPQIQHIDSMAGDFYEECDAEPSNITAADELPPQGTGIALYAYEGALDEASGSTITMQEQDELLLLERDVGDGWTRVRHRTTNLEGFVPTTYLECRWY